MRLQALVIIGVLVVGTSVGFGKDLYVDNVIGDDTTWYGANDETNPWKTLQRAADKVKAGDTVWVKATGSPYAKFEMITSGDVGNKIKFIGYSSTEHDLDDGNSVPETHAGAAAVYLNPTVSHAQPLIEGSDRTSGIGISFGGQHDVEVHNFNITGFAKGVSTASGQRNDFCTIKNCFIWDIGNVSSSLHGWGVQSWGTGVNIIDCTVLNAAYAGIQVVYDGCIIDGCMVFADDDLTAHGGTDYYFLNGNGSGNEWKNCYAERVGQLEHLGHAFALVAWVEVNNAEADMNIYENCHGKNIGDFILLRGFGCHSNQFYNMSCVVDAAHEEEEDLVHPGHRNIGCIQITSGGYNNTFERISLENADTAIVFNTTEWPNNSSEQFRDRLELINNGGGSLARNNKFYNCVFECETAIDMTDGQDEIGFHPDFVPPGGDLSDGSDLSVDDNEWHHCTFISNPDPYVGNNGFVRAARASSGNVLRNCIVTGFDRYKSAYSRHPSNTNYIPYPDGNVSSQVVSGFFDHADVEFCCFYNPNATGGDSFPYAGLTNVFTDPVLSYSGGIWTLGASSSCREKGGASSVSEDYFGNARPGNIPDIGHHEYDAP